MTKNKKYKLIFTTDTEVTFYDKNYNDNTRLVKAGETITATFIGDNATNGNYKEFRCGKELFAVSTYTFDSILVTSKKKVAMKQITVVVEIALTMEVPINMDSEQISAFIKNDTTWDVTSHNRNINMVETSDILDVSDILGSNGGVEVVSIVEAPID